MTSVVTVVNPVTSTLTVTENAATISASAPTTMTVTLATTGPQGAAGPTGPAGLIDVREQSTPPLGPNPGDQWVVVDPL